MARKQSAPVMKLSQPYADMVTRTHELCIGLLGQAQAGNVCGVLVEAERLAKQAGAIADLLSMRLKEERNG